MVAPSNDMRGNDKCKHWRMMTREEYCNPFYINANKNQRSEEVSYHKFPKSERLRKNWQQNIRLAVKTDDHGKFCSAHFTLHSDYKRRQTKRKVLKPRAIPSRIRRDAVKNGQGEMSENEQQLKTCDLDMVVEQEADEQVQLQHEIHKLKEQVYTLSNDFNEKVADLSRWAFNLEKRICSAFSDSGV